MEVRVLRYFIEVVQERNISNAAKRLHISQPTLSRQLMDLEKELGITLFERGHRQIKLTQEGYYLYERAQEITGLVDKTETDLQSQNVISGTLDIGAGESAAIQPAMTVIGDIIKKYPDIKINLVSGDSDQIYQRLNNGTLDFGIVMGPEKLLDYHSIRLPQKNTWGILMLKDHPLAKRAQITPEDLKGVPIITSAQSKEQDVFRVWAGSLIDQYNFIGQYNLIFNARLLVETGACLALTYKNLVNITGTNLIFHPLTPTITDQNNLIWNKNRQLSNVAQVFLNHLKEVQ
ncbi:LysR family transcriptional regulator [Limosilactobacillus reuteri]|uniref:LysR family transcriptional regulator n=1 Tax=Limosilactobacillus reuteri TaxID=1598 RepID=UPI001E2BC8A2|nr:LysR family transcriptional regulator [Limosilactobacillus reuteri]MCC4325501.1 LysR family transcriptional regulator [Limosilactobacillus reuteri]MCC4329220.1 LysR family transcriptional regulator [Limosilactobacillus reuteri]MCC4352691.1 LysR family transcriptional regulator [Limosilactobacillus reuteri]MCC4377483.1 LysR family transcriptional regulator [Limosilactobacillus reuteri]